MPRARPVPTDPPSLNEPGTDSLASPIGWQDIIHLQPDGFLPPAEQLARKRDRARRIQDSGQSQLSRGLQAAITWMDNIQDFLVTTSLVARAIAVKIPRLAPFAQLTGRAADATNLGNLVKSSRPNLATGKRRAETRLKQSPGYYAGRARNATTLAKALPNLPEILQAAQTADQLAGVGISLGAVMGTPLTVYDYYQDAKAQGLATAAREELDPTILDDPDRLWANRLPETQALSNLATNTAVAIAVAAAAPIGTALGLFADWVGRTLEAAPRPTRATAQQIRDTFDAVNGLSGFEDVLTPHEHLMIATAHHLALDWMTRTIPPVSLAALAAPFLPSLTTPPRPRNPLTRLVLGEMGIDLREPPRFPVPDSPTVLTMTDHIRISQDRAPRVLASWREALLTEDQENYAGALTCYAASAPWNTLAGTDVQWEDLYTPPARAAVTLLDYAIDITLDTTDAELASALEILGAAWFTDDQRAPDPTTAQIEFDAVLNYIRQGTARAESPS